MNFAIEIGCFGFSIRNRHKNMDSILAFAFFHSEFFFSEVFSQHFSYWLQKTSAFVLRPLNITKIGKCIRLRNKFKWMFNEKCKCELFGVDHRFIQVNDGNNKKRVRFPFGKQTINTFIKKREENRAMESEKMVIFIGAEFKGSQRLFLYIDVPWYLLTFVGVYWNSHKIICNALHFISGGEYWWFAFNVQCFFSVVSFNF